MTTNTDGAMPELLPCPFCGGSAFVNILEPHEHHFVLMPPYPGGATVECHNCNAGLIDDSVEAVAKAWNRRAAIQQADGCEHLRGDVGSRWCALAEQPECPAQFPQGILDLIKEVANREGSEFFGPWEDEHGEPLQDDADAALKWIAGQQAAGEDGEIVVTKTDTGAIVSVTRQDEEGRILDVIAQDTQQAAGAVPEGWTLVPLDPTQAMKLAGCATANDDSAVMCGFIYRAMLNASPPPPKQQPVHLGALLTEAQAQAVIDSVEAYSGSYELAIVRATEKALGVHLGGGEVGGVPLSDEQRQNITAMWNRQNRNYTVSDIIDAVEAAHGTGNAPRPESPTGQINKPATAGQGMEGGS